ncbi:DNA-binding transcriptional regulator, AcrR family [Amycolatopsis pretoriensis]|uniref:DNA-binding transcriptional regulator, AcrR family n=1 Tax=Amycolatopsis pretoriensis TaxID=218821 RepID=A0A1H5R876_9PSEU|nr:TetR/AcrR family transcriptional regulator [Amycolatopsis pretoriensis]SEF34586.1 DNA-binding transcriptional regulator, AcrR family [Amycolatopsis pretoriensis]
MPRLADHEQRRRQIAEAVWRIASARGLEDVSLRKVAAEAGVSLRLVQYYFGTRDDLLLGALEILNADAGESIRAELGPEEDAAPREVLRAMLVGMLPVGDERRTRYLVHLAYFVRSLSDPGLASAFSAAPPELERLTADLLAWGRDRGEVAPDLELMPEAELLLSSVDGLQTSIILGQRTPEAAVALIDHQLDRLFSLANVAT